MRPSIMAGQIEAVQAQRANAAAYENWQRRICALTSAAEAHVNAKAHSDVHMIWLLTNAAATEGSVRVPSLL